MPQNTFISTIKKNPLSQIGAKQQCINISPEAGTKIKI